MTGRTLTVPEDDVEQAMAPHPTHIQRLPQRQAKDCRVEDEDRAPRRCNICTVPLVSVSSSYDEWILHICLQ